jgi:hypothetical protein
LPTKHKILSNILPSRLNPYAEEIIGNHEGAFDTTGLLLIMYSAFVKYVRKNGITMKFISSL